ncbi:TPA: hypothetical protein U0K45_000623 [Streptococcus suis]|nr:hypothetical protein [Streptococcus suis]
MTPTETIAILVAALALTWTGIITGYALAAIKKHKASVEYYQRPEIQIAIANHVLKNKWYQQGGEVFK